MTNIDFDTFPKNRIQGLAYLYVQKKQYDEVTPELLAQDYQDAYKRIRAYFKESSDKADLI